MKASESAIWRDAVASPDVSGLSIRTTYPKNENGVDVMLEHWDAGTSEPPHSHPGDDLTIVVEGRMLIQFFKREAGQLVEDGDVVELKKGDSGHIAAGRIHDAKYVEACKLVYIHDRAFGFDAAEV